MIDTLHWIISNKWNRVYKIILITKKLWASDWERVWEREKEIWHKKEGERENMDWLRNIKDSEDWDLT